MNNLEAYKMDGLGNDFIIFDNRKKSISLSKGQIIKIADRNNIGCHQVIFIEKDKNNFVVYGSRVLKRNDLINVQDFSHQIRIYGNRFLTKFSNLINKQNLTDAHTCYKMFKSEIFKSIKLEENDFAFCPEITTKLSLLNINIKEVPINYIGRSYNEGKKITATDGFKAIFTIIKYRFLRNN